MRTDLSRFDNSWYRPGPAWKRALWFMMNVMFMKNPLFPFSGAKRTLLRLFGAKVGKGVVIKPCVNVKYPWKLEIGDHAWIGENVWIDNLDQVSIGANACISQGALILSGNHNFKKPTFDLMIAPIAIEDGAWVGAMSVVCQGVTLGSHSVLTVSSVATQDLESYGIYRGNPAERIRTRKIGEHAETVPEHHHS